VAPTRDDVLPMTGSASQHGAYGLGWSRSRDRRSGTSSAASELASTPTLCGEDAAEETIDDTLWAPLTSTILVMKPKLHAAREPYDWQHYPIGLPNLEAAGWWCTARGLQNAAMPQSQMFVGRDVELGAVEDLLRALGAGQGGGLYLAGEPGIGKTALIGEALARSRQRGYLTLSGRAAEFELELPFGLFTDALEHHLRSSPRAELWSLADGELALLAIVFPSLASHAVGEPLAAQPDKRYRLLRAMRALLQSLASKQPLVLALDDLHWADTASVDLLCHLLHAGFENPVLLLLASRPAQSQSRLLTALDGAERHGVTRRIELAPLSAAEAAALMGPELDAALRQALYRESGGNPFYLEQLTAAARHGAPLERREAEKAAAGVPATVRAAIQDELRALPAPARTLLQGGAVLGEPFEPELAADTAGIEAGEALQALDSLLDSDLIRPADVPRRFRFRHPIVRGAVYQAAGGGWRLAAHGRAAAALAARGAPASARALHVERSARTGDEEAIAVLVQAGQEAASHAPGSAARWLGAALRLLPERSDTLQRRAELLGQHAAALAVAGHLAASRQALEEFLRFSPQRPNPLRLKTTVLAAILDEVLGHRDSARRLLVDELATLPDQDSAAAAELQREVAFTCFLDADWKATGEWARRSLAAKCNGMVRVGALSALALASYGLGDIDQVRRPVSEAAALFDALTDEAVVAHHPGIATWLGRAECYTERFDDAIGHLERALAVSRACGQRHLTVAMLAVQGQALALRGRITELVEAAEAAVDAALLSASNTFLGWAMALRCQANIETGDLHAALRFGERGARASPRVASPLAGTAPLQLASALLEIGEPERCRDLLLTPEGHPNLPPFPLDEGLCYELLVRAELMVGHPEPAEVFASRAEESAHRLRLQIPLTQARRARALVLLYRGQPREAAAQALASAEAAEQAGAPIEAGRSRTLAGKALAVAGERDAAIFALQSAYEQLAGCGALRRLDEAARELRKLGRAVPRAGRERLSDSTGLGLTARELQVLEHVAAGRTNREVADELFLSVRTVDRHVSRIFDKLGVNSRAAATSQYERTRREGGVRPGSERP
jgi:ATP/maltotriose-dependent transcriptional regulator MalT